MHPAGDRVGGLEVTLGAVAFVCSAFVWAAAFVTTGARHKKTANVRYDDTNKYRTSAATEYARRGLSFLSMCAEESQKNSVLVAEGLVTGGWRALAFCEYYRKFSFRRSWVVVAYVHFCLPRLPRLDSREYSHQY